jgi:hypothetical protein
MLTAWLNHVAPAPAGDPTTLAPPDAAFGRSLPHGLLVRPCVPRRPPCEERLELVKNTLTTYSALDDDAASKLPVHVLHALNFDSPRRCADQHRAYQAPSPTVHSRNAKKHCGT